jgi:hypothetical protein
MGTQCLLLYGNSSLPGILRNAGPARLATELRLAGFDTICVDIGGLTLKHVSTIDKIIANNPKQTADYKAGKTNLLKFFVGQVMKETKGKANPQVAEDLFVKKLTK